jgi:hypothetical protein
MCRLLLRTEHLIVWNALEPKQQCPNTDTIFRNFYQKRYTWFRRHTNLPKVMREQLGIIFSFIPPNARIHGERFTRSREMISSVASIAAAVSIFYLPVIKAINFVIILPFILTDCSALPFRFYFINTSWRFVYDCFFKTFISPVFIFCIFRESTCIK